jgi:hypothetical protein
MVETPRMGMFDYYDPQPPVHCPMCQAPLTGWQGKEGPGALLRWRQGALRAVDQLVDDGKLDATARQRVTLPTAFELYTTSCDRHWVQAVGRCVGDTWTSTDMVTVVALKRPRRSRGSPAPHVS